MSRRIFDFFAYIKKFTLGGTIQNKEYRFAPKDAEVLLLADNHPQTIYVRYADADSQAIRQQVSELQGKGFYVLGIASKEIQPNTSLDQAEAGMTFLGLLALIDPPRTQAAQAIASALGAGIRVVMITGDHKLTAESIARQLELPPGRAPVAGTEWPFHGPLCVKILSSISTLRRG